MQSRRKRQITPRNARAAKRTNSLAGGSLFARGFELLRAGGVAALLYGSAFCGLTFCGSSFAAEHSVLAAPRNSVATSSATNAPATTVFKRTANTTAAAATTKSDSAALEWRVRTPKSSSSNAQPAKSAVKQAQYEAEAAPAKSSGPILRAANDSVLLPPKASTTRNPGTSTAITPRGSTQRITPRRLSADDVRSLRPVKQGTEDELAPRTPAPRRNYADDLPSESTTQPEPADDIFGNPAAPKDAPPADTAPKANPNGEAPAEQPMTETPMTEVPMTEQPKSETPMTETPKTDPVDPPTGEQPGRITLPPEEELPRTPASDREREMENVLFGPVGADGQRLGGELGDCLETNVEVRNSRAVNISVDISPPIHDKESTWSFDRPWRDITGKTLFTGRPINLNASTQEATFLLTDGSKRTIKIRELNRIEQGYFFAMYPLPVECHLIDEPYRDRNWIASTYTWKASGACHKPLYFEEVHLERYGHSAGPILQPLVSSAHFFGTLPILPYKMGVHPPTECMYTLGYYRPGNCAPYMLDPLPLSARGALFEAGAWVGGVVVIP